MLYEEEKKSWNLGGEASFILFFISMATFTFGSSGSLFLQVWESVRWRKQLMENDVRNSIILVLPLHKPPPSAQPHDAEGDTQLRQRKTLGLRPREMELNNTSF